MRMGLIDYSMGEDDGYEAGLIEGRKQGAKTELEYIKNWCYMGAITKEQVFDEIKSYLEKRLAELK
jgi:hypothetical protein